MTPTVPITIPTGKNNMLGSLNAYLLQYLPLLLPSDSYQVKLEQYEEAAEFPCISIEEIGMPGMGAYAFDNFMGKYVDDAGNTQEFFGKLSQTMIEFNMQADASQAGNEFARQQVYQMFDQLDFLLRYTGHVDHTGAQILPPIPLIDYDQLPSAATYSEIWCPTEKDSIMFPTYIGVDPERPGIRRLSLRARINWQQQETPSVDMSGLLVNNAGQFIVNNASSFITQN